LFKKIRQVFSKFIEKASSVIYSRDKLLEALDELKMELISNDVAFEVVEDISEKILEAIDKKEIKNKD